jgi:hypothetical protein
MVKLPNLFDPTQSINVMSVHASGVNFNNILCPAFLRTDPESAKNTDICIFFGSAGVNAARKMLKNLTPDVSKAVTPNLGATAHKGPCVGARSTSNCYNPLIFTAIKLLSISSTLYTRIFCTNFLSKQKCYLKRN